MKTSVTSVLGTAALLAIGASAQAATITVPGDSIGGGQLVGTTFTIGMEGFNGGQNNWPGNEAPAAAIDANSATKYLNFAELNAGYIVTPTAGLSIVTGAEFTTANDAPERDPLTFTLYGSNSEIAGNTPGLTFSLTDFTLIATGSTGLATDPGRFVTAPPVTFPNVAPYTTYLLVFPTVRNEAAANSVQIAEAILTGRVVPEPSALLFAGLAGVGFLRRRR